MSDAEERKLTDREYLLLEIGATIAKAIDQLAEVSRVTIKRDDIGYKITASFNWSSVVKIDVSRLDKLPFFQGV